MIRIDRKKLVNKFKISSCVKRVSFGDITGQSQQFWKKVAHAGGLDPWNARVSITREKHYSSTNFAKTNRENTNKKSKVKKCPAYNHIQVFTAMLHPICQRKWEKQHWSRSWSNMDDDDNSDTEAYFDEPMPDETWLEDYSRRREEDKERLQQLRFGRGVGRGALGAHAPRSFNAMRKSALFKGKVPFLHGWQ